MSTRPSVEDIIAAARGDGPRKRDCSLYLNNGAVTVCLDKQAIRDAGRDPEDPGEATQYISQQHDLVVIDLSGEERDIGLFDAEADGMEVDGRGDE